MKRNVLALAVTLALGFSLFASACGSGPAPGVATLGTTSPRNPSTLSSHGRNAVAYAACMTAHGIAMSPPSSHQGLTILGDAASNSSQFEAAESACRRFEPAGGPPPLTPAQEAQAARALARFAACMRAHGVPDFPDPDGQGTFPDARIEALDSQSLVFQRALEDCDGLYPERTVPGLAFPGGRHT